MAEERDEEGPSAPQKPEDLLDQEELSADEDGPPPLRPVEAPSRPERFRVPRDTGDPDEYRSPMATGRGDVDAYRSGLGRTGDPDQYRSPMATGRSGGGQYRSPMASGRRGGGDYRSPMASGRRGGGGDYRSPMASGRRGGGDEYRSPMVSGRAAEPRPDARSDARPDPRPPQRPQAQGRPKPAQKRPMFAITCAACSKAAEVPFKPAEGREVLCQECFRARKQGG